MRRLIGLAAAVGAAVGAAPAAAGEPLPRVRGKVGDYVVVKQTKEVGGAKQDTKLRLTLTDLGAESATVSWQAVLDGVNADLPTVPIPGVPVGVDLDPAQLVDNAYVRMEGEPKVLGTGKEKVAVGGKTFACTWAEHRVTAADGETVTTTKYWVCPDAPLTGLVKAVVTAKVPGLGDTKTTYEVTEAGAK